MPTTQRASGMLRQCGNCGHRYNPSLHRHCPHCIGGAKQTYTGSSHASTYGQAAQQNAIGSFFAWEYSVTPYTESHWGTVNEERIEGKFRIEFNLKRCTNCNVNILYRLEYPVPQFGDEMVTELGKIECPGCQTIITTGDFKTTPVGHTLRIIDAWTDNVDIQGFKPNLLEERKQELHKRELELAYREREAKINISALNQYESTYRLHLQQAMKELFKDFPNTLKKKGHKP